MGYREKWFQANPPDWRGRYKCVKCHKKFYKNQIEIDHRIPKRKGGTDDLWNLQPMCRHCNRSKGKNQSGAETAVTVISATIHGDLGKATGGIAKQAVKDILHIKYRR